MAGRIDYKQKYEELKNRFMSCVDAAWEDGFRHGMESSQLDQAQQTLAQPQPGEEPAGQPGVAAPEAPDQTPTPAGEQPSNAPQEDELGKHIEQLESMLGKGEFGFSDIQDLKKTLNDIRSLQVQINLTKSMESIKNTKMSKPAFSLSPKVKANLPQPAQKSLTMQEEIVKGIFEKWEKDAASTASDINSLFNIEGLTKPKGE